MIEMDKEELLKLMKFIAEKGDEVEEYILFFRDAENKIFANSFCSPEFREEIEKQITEEK